MAPKRKNTSSLDKLLANGINGKAPKMLSVEKCLRSDARGISDQDIQFIKSVEPLNASSLVDLNKVTILEPNKAIFIPKTHKNEIFDCFVGTAVGTLKSINLTTSNVKNLYSSVSLSRDSTEPNRKRNSIIPMTFSGPDQTEVLICQADGELKLYNILTNTCSDLFNVKGDSISIVKGVQVTQNHNIVSGLENGELSIWNRSGERISKEKWSCGANLQALRISTNDDRLATGGDENPLKIWDLNTEKSVFTAKNVRPDSLELRVPINELNMRFLNDGPCVVTTTGRFQVRLYDPRVQRRPVKELEWLDSPIQALSTCSRENCVLAGNNRGELGLFDLRSSKINLASKYKGFVGAIRSIDAHPTKPIFVSCGVDRFVIAHDLNTRKVLKKIYCKVQLNTILFSKENSLTKEKTLKKETKDEESDENESEDDESSENDSDSEDNDDEESGNEDSDNGSSNEDSEDEE